ncbi:hypothetical protein PV325_000658, partial [Microctonus aethiopoides]
MDAEEDGTAGFIDKVENNKLPMENEKSLILDESEEEYIKPFGLSEINASDDDNDDDDINDEDNNDNENWYYMPDSILLSIFQLLTPKEVMVAGSVCKSWNRVSHDELLWKELFYRTYKIDPSVGIMPGKTSWLGEFKRLTYHTPLLETEVLKEHSHQVLHVSFSHNGKMFATCSKDGYIFVWDSQYPVTIKYHHDMK